MLLLPSCPDKFKTKYIYLALIASTIKILLQTFCDIKDVSYGKENVKISCVNGIDRSYPDYVEYSCERQPGKGVFLTTDSEFLVGCDCTDGCRVSGFAINNF